MHNLVCRVFAAGLSLMLCNVMRGDDAAAVPREQLQQAADAARAALDAASNQLEAVRQQQQQLEAQLLEARRDMKKAEQGLAAAQGRLAAEQEAATKSADASQQAVQAKQAADEALAKATEAAKPDLADAEKQAAEKSIADARSQLDAATKTATDAAAQADAAQKTLAATQQVIAAAKAAVDAGNKQIETLQAGIEASQQQLAASEAQVSTTTDAWVLHQRALEAALREAGEWISFTDEIAPILQQRCVACHNTRTAEGRLNLSSFAGVRKGGESGPAVDPPDDEYSVLCVMVEDGSMPKDAQPLAEEQIARIKRWVQLGAKLDAGADPDLPLIRIMPKPQQPAAPETYRVAIPVTAVALSPDGALLATSGYHEVLIWKTDDGSLVRRIGNVAERVYDLDFHADGQRLAIAAGTPGELGEARIVNVADGTLVRDLVTVEDALFAAAFSPDGTRLAAAGADRSIRVFNAGTGAEELLIEDHADWVMSLAWSPDGSKLASASRDKTAKLFSASSGDALVTFNGHGEIVYGVDFLPDGTQVASVGADKRIRVWDVEKAEQKREIAGFGGDVFQIEVLPDGQAVTCSADKTARLHTLADGKEVRKFTGHKEWVYAVAVHPGSRRLATGSHDGEVRLWNFDDASVLLTFPAAPGLEQVSAAAN